MKARTAMLLAAGRGERLRPLTDAMPKPLVPAGGKALIDWQVERLVAAGFRDLVVNHAFLGERIEAHLGDGARFGARIRYSPEVDALETAGGIAHALPLLGREPFALVSSDIHTDYPYERLGAIADDIAARPAERAAHLVLVENPAWHPAGDMGLIEGRVSRTATPRYTYASFAVFHPLLFASFAPLTHLRLFPWVHQFSDAGRVTGEVYRGPWDNVGTLGQLETLDARLRAARG